jgi:soluble lytic murein transglycosylase
MPKVPVYDNLQAIPGIPQAKLDAGVVRPDMQALTMPGQNMERAGDLMSQHAQESGSINEQMARTAMGGAARLEQAGQNAIQTGENMLETQTHIRHQMEAAKRRADTIRVDDALNQAKELQMQLTYDPKQGFSSLKGLDALQRPDNQPLSQEYGNKLKDGINSISDTLGNDEQKQLFAIHAGALHTQFQGDAMRHEAQEFQTYALSVREGTIKTNMDAIGKQYNEPDKVDASIQSIQAAAYDQARMLGKSATWAEAHAKQLTSDAHVVALESALQENNIAYATGYLKKYAGQMEANDVLKVQGVLKNEVDNHIGMSVANRVMQQAAAISNPGDSDRAFNILIKAESGGKQFDDSGQPLTSSKGAIGITQMIPTTAQAAAKLAGVPFDLEKLKTDQGYATLLGRTWFNKLVKQYPDDLRKAYAAYNAGEGGLDDGMEKAKQSGGDWLAYMPKETVDYVNKNMAAYNSGRTGDSASWSQILSNIKADPTLQNNQKALHVAISNAEMDFNAQTQAAKQFSEANVANAMRMGEQSGWRLSNLPTQVRANIPPKELENIQNYFKKMAKGDDTTDLRIYDNLTNHPELLGKMSGDAFYALRQALSESDLQHFSNEREKITKKSASDLKDASDLNTQAIKSGLDDRLRMIGIDPTPKSDGGAGDMQVGGIRKYVNDYMLSAQHEAGKKFTDSEVNQQLDGLFAKNAVVKGFFSDSSKPMIGMKVGDIPSEDRQGIKDALKRSGNDNPTDAQILNVYWSLNSIRK